MASAVEEAVRARIAAARARIARQRTDRAARARRRAYGLAQRHAAKLARQHAAETNPQETDVADRLSPDEASLGQCLWAVVGAAMDEDVPAVEYLLSGLTAADLRPLIYTMAGMIGSTLTAAYGPEDARRQVAANAVRYAAGTDA